MYESPADASVVYGVPLLILRGTFHEASADPKGTRQMLLVAQAIRALENQTSLASELPQEATIAGSGLLQVASDPHARVGECLRALLRAELVDDEGWAVLAELAERMGQYDLAVRFRQACRSEMGLSRVAL